MSKESHWRLSSAATPQLRSKYHWCISKKGLVQFASFCLGCWAPRVWVWIGLTMQRKWEDLQNEAKTRLYTLSSSAHNPFLGHNVLMIGMPWDYTFPGALMQSLVGKPDSAYSISVKVMNTSLFLHEYEWHFEGWMQPKNLREKWAMKHFWKCIRPKTVLLHILCPSQYATKGLSHQGSPARHEQTRTKVWKINAECKAIFYGKVQLLQCCLYCVPQPVLLFQAPIFQHL